MMVRLPLLRAAVAVLAVCLLSTVALRAAPPAGDVLLPNTTKGYLSAPNVPALRAAWDQTQYGQLLDTEEMRAFSADLRRQLREKWAEDTLQLGITWDDIEAIAQGEAAVALVQEEPGKPPRTVVLVDTTGQRDATDKLLERIGDKLKDQGAKQRRETVVDTPVTVFDLPARRGSPGAKQVCYFVRDEMLVAADDLAVVSGILGRWQGQGRDRLAAHEPYRAVMDRLQADLGEGGAAPHAEWFVEPLELAAARRVLDPETAPDEDSTDYLELLRKEGFGALDAAAGTIHFGSGEFDVVQRVAIHAKKPLKKSARMLVFPGAAPYPPPSWAPADVAVYVAAQWDLRSAFEMSKTLINRLAGDDVFEDIIDSMKEDPLGAQIDIRQDIIEKLGQKVAVLFDNSEPISADSEQRLFAAEVTDVETVRKAIDKLISTNQAAKRHEVHGHNVWEVPPEDVAVAVDDGAPAIEIEGAGNLGGDDEEDEEGEGSDEDFLAGSFIAVENGYLFVSSHLDLMTKVLRPEDQQTSIAAMPEFQAIDKALRAELERRGLSEASFRGHSRTDREFQGAYEQVRSGALPESNSLLGWVLNAALGGNPDARRAQEIDGSTLPDYEVARRYFGPAGWFVASEESGWFLVNFTLRPTPPAAQAAAE